MKVYDSVQKIIV